MLLWRSRCKDIDPQVPEQELAADHARFVDCEKWREETKLDELVPTWDYPEKAEIQKYYKQFYHKTDKVRPRLLSSAYRPTSACLTYNRMAAPSTSRPSAAST